jgi:hypothetical protein
VLDDVERRRFLVQPARKHPLPAPVGQLDVELDERPGQHFILPRRGRLAGAQPHDDVLEAHRLAGPQRQVADDPIALVEQAEDRDALGHRRDARLGAGRRCGGRGGPLSRRLPLGLAAAVAAGGAQADGNQQSRSATHAQSGVHG